MRVSRACNTTVLSQTTASKHTHHTLQNGRGHACYSCPERHSASHAGAEQLRAQQAGCALARLSGARDALAASAAASRGYARAPPVTSAAEHEYADAALKDAVERPYAMVGLQWPCLTSRIRGDRCAAVHQGMRHALVPTSRRLHHSGSRSRDKPAAFWTGQCEIASFVLCCAVTQAKRDNERVYFQHVPAAGSLAAIEPRRLTSLTAYVLPPPAPLVSRALQDAFVEVPADKVGPGWVPALPFPCAAACRACFSGMLHMGLACATLQAAGCVQSATKPHSDCTDA